MSDLPPDSFRYIQIRLVVEEVTHNQNFGKPFDSTRELKGYAQTICVFDLKPETDNYGRLGKILGVLAAIGKALGDEE